MSGGEELAGNSEWRRRPSHLHSERIAFSRDWPFEHTDHAAGWVGASLIGAADRLKIK